MKCDKCGCETEAGETYRFYFGTRLGKSYSGGAPVMTETTHFRIYGSRHKFFCHRCVIARDAQNLIFGSLVFLALIPIAVAALTYLGRDNPGNANDLRCFVALGSLAGLAGMAALIHGISLNRMANRASEGDLVVYFDKERSSLENSGDQMAINTDRKELENRGMDSFFTRTEYSKMWK